MTDNTYKHESRLIWIPCISFHSLYRWYWLKSCKVILMRFQYTNKTVEHWNGNVFILMKFSSLAALKVVKMTTSSAASDENFIKMTTFSFQWVMFCHFPVFSWCFTLTHWGWHRNVATSQTTFSNAVSWMKMFKFWFKFHLSLFPRVQSAIFQHWFR